MSHLIFKKWGSQWHITIKNFHSTLFPNQIEIYTKVALGGGGRPMTNSAYNIQCAMLAEADTKYGIPITTN